MTGAATDAWLRRLAVVWTTDTVADTGADVADAGEWRSAIDRGYHSKYGSHKRTSNVV